ncbi:hypothetical protein ULMS_00470 [Patiriisocius marinistellae]|uniref:FAD-dependent urate hydroxylase HpyO/Asp monooxygenase CreE-like FAD/NAD(P)-binding domain-containing protein n=1 Tax=Patiriisocius marinistellae TaxID=2494560 RepID=A0A5J4FWW0_9FLAO|nr:FAD/NAD(P)-binding protein [Patiriisocius marinistellae]GEQ84539.1 hypothetical protein ULMS_00470 [Patiriisocius marinistellae]
MKIAIIGFGPRGLACLENLVLELSSIKTKLEPHFLIYEISSHLGTGKAWEINQPKTNYINISDHALQNLKGREKMLFNTIEIPSFPSYITWCKLQDKIQNIDQDEDVYPPRSQMGQYLNERAKSIYNILKKENFLTIYKERVTEVSFKNSVVTVKSEKSTVNVEECLLTIGHTPVKDSDETKEFKAHSNQKHIIYIDNPYEEKIAIEELKDAIVAIKGFGLSMLDVARQLTNYKYGEFKEKQGSNYLQFIPEKGCVKKIIPYSFDGLPCVPKPYGRKVDSSFEPSISQQNWFELTLKNKLLQPEKIDNCDFILKAFSHVAATIYSHNSSNKVSVTKLEAIANKWLQDTSTAHDLILDTTLPTVKYMKQTVEMAWGNIEPTLDFHIGQVWRHLQPIMYRLFAFSGVSGDVIKQLIDIDQEVKRYSYGPPMESILQLIALHEAAILDLNYVNDPNVDIVESGWEITKNDTSVTAIMLCNSVMDAPVLQQTDSSIFKKLIEEKLIQPVHKDLGIKTNPDATIIPAKKHKNIIPIAVVGRNTKGSIFGTDAILECFSPETHDWERGVVARVS